MGGIDGEVSEIGMFVFGIDAGVCSLRSPYHSTAVPPPRFGGCAWFCAEPDAGGGAIETRTGVCSREAIASFTSGGGSRTGGAGVTSGTALGRVEGKGIRPGAGGDTTCDGRSDGRGGGTDTPS